MTPLPQPSLYNATRNSSGIFKVQNDNSLIVSKRLNWGKAPNCLVIRNNCRISTI